MTPGTDDGDSGRTGSRDRPNRTEVAPAVEPDGSGGGPAGDRDPRDAPATDGGGPSVDVDRDTGEASVVDGGEDPATSTEARSGDVEGPVRTLDTRIRLKWYGQVVLALAVLGALGTGLSMATDVVQPWLVAVVVLPLLAIGLLWVRLRYRLWAFQFRTDHLFLERGVYRNVETVVPYVRIQHVDTSRGPVERVLGLSTLVVYTAGSRGADVAIPGLPAAEAESMQDRVKELAVAAEGGEGL